MNRMSFWLLPPKLIQDQYQPIIDSWSRKLKTPRFEPHITLAFAGLLKGEAKSVLPIVEKVAKNLKPIPIDFSKVSVSTTYYQCVFAQVKPNHELLRAHQLINSALRYHDPSMFVPHMSLVYGNLDLAQRFTVAAGVKLPVTEFLADRICVINADSLNPKTWQHLAEFEL